MPTMDNALVAGGKFGSSSDAWISNVVGTGQHGFGPNIPSIDAATPLVILPCQAVVVSTPKIFKLVDGGEKIFKAIIEECVTTWDGLDSSLSLDSDGMNVGRDSQQLMAPTRSNRSQITPSATIPERLGNPIFNLFEWWVKMVSDPDTQAASMASLVPSGTALPPLTMSWFAADIMYLMYDRTYRPENLIRAQLCTNMVPSDIGAPGWNGNLTEVTRPDRQISFTTLMQDGPNVTARGKQIAQALKLHEVDFQKALPGVSDLSTALSGGLATTTANVLSQFTTLSGAVA
jgi:hypothetical protein